MKGKTFIRILAIAAIIVIFANIVSAQPRRPRRFRRAPVMQPASSIGIRFGNDFKNDQYLAGAHFWMPIGIFWQFAPSADYYFTDTDYKRWQFNGDVIFKPRPAGPFYFGGGVAVQYLTKDEQSDVGGNILVGLEFSNRKRAVMAPYIQARWTFLDNYRYFSLLGGVNLILR